MYIIEIIEVTLKSIQSSEARKLTSGQGNSTWRCDPAKACCVLTILIWLSILFDPSIAINQVTVLICLVEGGAKVDYASSSKPASQARQGNSTTVSAPAEINSTSCFHPFPIVNSVILDCRQKKHNNVSDIYKPIYTKMEILVI